MTNAITGAHGFIGMRLFAKLLQSESRTFAIDHIGGKIYLGTDRVFFLSAYGNMSHHDDVRKMVIANAVDVNKCLSIASGYFLYVSSSSVTLPVQTPYSRTKRAGEEILQAYPVPSCIVRPYSVTGSGEQKEHLIPTLIRSCMEGEEMPFVPDAVHDFVDVADVVSGIVMLADDERTGIHELGSGRPVTNDEVRRMVELQCGKPANIVLKEGLRAYDTKDWYCKNPAAGWKPKKSLVQSIKEMVEEYKHAH